MTHNPDSLGAALPTANAILAVVRDPRIIPGDAGESHSAPRRDDFYEIVRVFVRVRT